MSSRTSVQKSVEEILNRLYESHDVSAYEAVERLVEAGEAAEFDVDTLLAMLRRGVALQTIFDQIVSKTDCTRKVA